MQGSVAQPLGSKGSVKGQVGAVTGSLLSSLYSLVNNNINLPLPLWFGLVR
jgi:hypothetical protein